MNERQNVRDARAEMEAAKAENEKRLSGNALPRRYKLYDKIKDHVSLKAIDAVIVVSALLIVGFLVYGILTATP